MKKILVVFGTRPEAIKLAPVIKQLLTFPNEFHTVVCVTAQHRFLLDQVLELFEIKPHYDLDLMQPNQTLFDLSTGTLNGIEQVVDKEKPDLILVQGDTTTAFISGLAGFYHKIPIGHIEAGLRTGDKYNPFPEEINRKLICVLSDFHFTPTATTKNNLLYENIPEDQIYVTGNTVVDALHMAVKKNVPLTGFGLEKVNFNKRIILVTAHRRETFGKFIQEICIALSKLAINRQETEIIYPVHLNPNIEKPVHEILGHFSNIHLVPPMEYGLFVSLMNKSYLILTDSGGIQEEAPSLGKPVLVLREITERSEAVEAGTVKVVGRKHQDILDAITLLLDDESVYQQMSQSLNPYGDGKAAERICSIIHKKMIAN